MERVTLCFHHNDADGRAAAAIVQRALGGPIKFYEMKYGDPIPWRDVARAQRVVVVDFSFPLQEMQRLAQGRELIWIDHHISAIEDLGPHSQSWAGVRDTREAACVLAWQYFFPAQKLPRAIFLIGDRDTWHWHDPDTGAFDEVLFQQNTDPTHDAVWGPLLDNDLPLVQSWIERGRELRQARLNAVRRVVELYGFPITFEGMTTLAINTRGNGDIGGFIRELGYQMAYCYIDNRQNEHLTTFVSLYSNDIDVSEIARKYGGGGHRGAAGFSFERGETPFPPGANVNW